MDCRIRFINQGLYCDTHEATGMSAMCDVAEQELRDRIAGLELALTDAEDKIRRLEGP